MDTPPPAQPTLAPPIHAVQVNLNGQGVVSPVYRAVRDSLEVLGFALDAIEKADLATVPPIPGGMMGFGLSSPEPIDLVERKATYTNWLLSKAFQDLARAVNESLQEAYFYVEMLALPGGMMTWGQLQDLMKRIRGTANKMNFPDLLKHVGDRLNTPLNFGEEYASLQRVRNCLEHRAGVVGERDLDANGKLKLRFPTYEISVKKGDGTEVIIAQQDEVYVEAGEAIAFRIGRIEKEYALGDRVGLTPFDYVRIAQGCIAFCADLGGKLPTRVIGVPTARLPTTPPGQLCGS
jgi:hypothetical protein